MTGQDMNKKERSRDHGSPVSSLAKKVLYGDIWYARFRLFFLVILLNLIAAGLAIYSEDVSIRRVWHNLFYPSLIFTAVFVTGFYIIRDLMEGGEFGIAFPVFLLVVILALLSWFEFNVVVTTALPGPFVGHYLLAPLAVFLGSMFAGAKYLQDIYSIESYNLAFLYLISSLFGIAYPNLTITDGQRQIEIGRVNRLDLIGGPGYITVSPSDAVLIHEPPNVSRVYSASAFFVPRFGKIISVVNLQDQRATIEEAAAYTKDGIKITVRNVEFRYRIWSDSRKGNHSDDKRRRAKPHPYEPQAVRDSVFNLSVNDKELTSWLEAVKGVLKGKITDYIASHQFDQIVTPDFQKGDPRKQVYDQLSAPETKSRLMNIGTKLLWCGIGHFEEDKAALQQHLDTWSAKWIGSANVIRAEGDAQRIAYQELGRAEAQASMLMSIIHAFDDIDLSPENKDQNIRNVILMRTAQVLESLIDFTGTSATGRPSSSQLFSDAKNEEAS